MDRLPLSQRTTQSISPSASQFKECIDQKVRDLVLHLNELGYKTTSSCEGHGIFDARYVVLAFSSLDSRHKFIQKIKCMSGQISWVEIQTCTKEVINGVTLDYGSLEDEIKSFNHLFSANEEFYCFLKVYLGDKIFAEREVEFVGIEIAWNLWPLLRGAVYNFLRRDKITQKFRALIIN